MVYTTEKTLKEMEGKIDSAKIKGIKDKADELKKLLEPEKKDANAIKAKLDEVNKLFQEASTELYQKAQQAQPQKENASGNTKEKNKGEKVVDADYKVEGEDKENKTK